MSAALAILLGLLSLCPAIVAVDGPVIPCLIPLLLAAGLVLIEFKLPPGKAQHMATVFFRPVLIGAAVPAVLMIMQMLPLPFLANPVWTSVSAASRMELPEALVLTLAPRRSPWRAIFRPSVRYCSQPRSRSTATGPSWVWIGTAAATVLISFAALFDDLFDFNVLAMREEALDCACLGVTLAAACALLALERYETRRSKPGQTQKKFLLAGLACLAAFLICAGAVAAARSGSLIFAAASGFLTFCAAVTIRRWVLGRVGAAAIGVTAAVIAAAVATVAASSRTCGSPSLKQTRPPSNLLSAS